MFGAASRLTSAPFGIDAGSGFRSQDFGGKGALANFLGLFDDHLSLRLVFCRIKAVDAATALITVAAGAKAFTITTEAVRSFAAAAFDFDFGWTEWLSRRFDLRNRLVTASDC